MIEIAVGLAATVCLGAVTWGVKLNTRVAVLEANHTSLVILIESHFKEVNRRLAKIETNTNGKPDSSESSK